MSTFDEEHGLHGPTCVRCGMVNCVSVRGCAKRQRDNRHRRAYDELATLRARLADAERVIEAARNVRATLWPQTRTADDLHQELSEALSRFDAKWRAGK